MKRYVLPPLYSLALLSCGHPPLTQLPGPAGSPLFHLAQTLAPGDLVGVALDSLTGQPLWAAQVVVSDSVHFETIGAITDSLGVFVLHSLPSGQQMLTIRLIGYCPKRLSVPIPPPAGFAFLATVSPARCQSGTPPSDYVTCTCP